VFKNRDWFVLGIVVPDQFLANPDRPWKSEIVEADGLRGLEQYAAAYGEFLETGPVNSELQF